MRNTCDFTLHDMRSPTDIVPTLLKLPNYGSKSCRKHPNSVLSRQESKIVDTSAKEQLLEPFLLQFLCKKFIKKVEVFLHL